MQDGDISNSVAPRFLLIFEGLIGYFEDGVAEKKERAYARLRRYKAAANCWTIDQGVTSHMWDLVWRFDYSIDVATYKQGRYADAIKELLDEYGVPMGNYYSTTPEILTRQLSYMPYVKRVFYRVPESLFAFGDRGVLVQGKFSPWM